MEVGKSERKLVAHSSPWLGVWRLGAANGQVFSSAVEVGAFEIVRDVAHHFFEVRVSRGESRRLPRINRRPSGGLFAWASPELTRKAGT